MVITVDLQKMLKVVSNIFIAFGLVLLLFVGYKVWEENNPARLSFDSFYPLSVPQEFNFYKFADFSL